MGGREKPTRQEVRNPRQGRFARKSLPHPAHDVRPYQWRDGKSTGSCASGACWAARQGSLRVDVGRLGCSAELATKPVGGVTGEVATRGPARGGRRSWGRRSAPWDRHWRGEALRQAQDGVGPPGRPLWGGGCCGFGGFSVIRVKAARAMVNCMPRGSKVHDSGRSPWTFRHRVTVLIPRISEARFRFHRVAWRTSMM